MEYCVGIGNFSKIATNVAWWMMIRRIVAKEGLLMKLSVACSG